jgi:hypothetical protein
VLSEGRRRCFQAYLVFNAGGEDAVSSPSRRVCGSGSYFGTRNRLNPLVPRGLRRGGLTQDARYSQTGHRNRLMG